MPISPSNARRLSIGAIAVFGLAVGAPALAQQQLRVAVSPAAHDAVWAVRGVTFEKSATCSFSTSATQSATWPVPAALDAGTGSGKAPLFNPGLLLASGGYDRTKPDDGFNTLFVPVPLKSGAQSFVCHGAILANGTDVTKATASRTVAASLSTIAQKGPLTVLLELDPAKLAGVEAPKPPAQLAERPARAVRSQGSGMVHQGKSWDLDSGKEVTNSDPAADIYMSMLSAETHANVQNGAVISDAVLSADLPKDVKDQRYDYCLKAVKTVQSVYSPKGYEKRYACVKTNEGRIALLTIYATINGAYNTGNNHYIPLDYTVWEK